MTIPPSNDANSQQPSGVSIPRPKPGIVVTENPGIVRIGAGAHRTIKLRRQE